MWNMLKQSSIDTHSLHNQGKLQSLTYSRDGQDLIPLVPAPIYTDDSQVKSIVVLVKLSRASMHNSQQCARAFAQQYRRLTWSLSNWQPKHNQSRKRLRRKPLQRRSMYQEDSSLCGQPTSPIRCSSYSSDKRVCSPAQTSCV